ncbi:MAG TPA: sigma 54-interacting transcriptional regulator [Pyrinomonadaceae bacterium]|jgi:Nif-specific regulatory protein|nr:sigma 54-interacting transcriptional regulator [Pyrinomonadaceae bacterium]
MTKSLSHPTRPRTTTSTGTTAPAADESRRLATLLEIGQTLAGPHELKVAMARALEILGRHHGMVRGVVMLLENDSDELRIEASHGMNENGARRISYRVGEGITGRVVQSGKPIIVPQVSREPMFLDRLGLRKKTADKTPAPKQVDRQEMSYLCVPVMLNQKPVGVVGVDMKYQEGRDYDGLTKFLAIVAAMIAQAVKVRHLVEAERQSLLDENIHLKQELRERYDFSHIIGNSNPLRGVYEQVTQVARTNTTVLLRGESGTGKELIAHAIHYNSLRANKAFIKVNCAALPETLIESELFGYEKGAFTGAAGRKKGRFELADGGTLFLDEIGDLNLSTQIKLLRVLQEREFERLGGTETIKVNVRLIAATNKELEKSIAAAQFREDLYYRLNVFTIFMPPLRERKSDILLLADHFLEKYSREHGKRIKRISTPAIDMLTSYHWPGNVRELENILERAVLVCETNVIHGHHLPPTLQTAEGSGTVTQLSLAGAIEAYERDIILDALKTTRGNRKKAAKLLDTTERILGYKVRKYHIDCERFRP